MMQPYKLSMAQWAFIPLVLGALSGCIDGGNGSTPDASSNSASDSAAAVLIDATAGGLGINISDPANKYTYFNLDAGQIVALSDADASVNSAWHVAFKRTSIKLNGGVSGPGSVTGALADAQEGFYNTDGTPNTSVFLNSTAVNELAAFDAVTSINGRTFAEDRNIAYVKGDGSSNGWWLYSGPPSYTVSANPNQWWLIKSAAANSYAKFRVTNIVQASRDITLELFTQGAADSAFSPTATLWTAAIGAVGGSKCFDIDTALEVSCATGAADWDIKVEVAGQAWNIWTNGGVSGSGSGGAFGPFDNTVIGGYVSGTASPGGTDITRMYGQDSAGGIFKDNTWYAYSLQGNNKLWPNYRIYAIDTGLAQYKLQILSYYNDAGVSGWVKFRYKRL